MTRWVAIIPLVLVLALGGVFALNIGRESSVIPSALIGKPVPDFNLPPLPGRETGLSGGDFTGSGVSVLNVFASWCVPCRAEHPVIAQLAEQTGIPVYGLNYKERDPADGGRWLEELGDPYTSVGMDLSGRTGIDFGVYGVPETFIIDGRGHIRYKHVGPVTPDDLRTEFLPRIAELRAQ